MRCHAKYGPFRCDLEMSEHLADRHVFTVEWGEDGEGIGRTADEVDLLGYFTAPMPSTGVSGDGLPETIPAGQTLPIALVDEVVEAEPGETNAKAGVSADGRRWWLNPQTGGIVWEGTKAQRCSICNHPWHEEPCTVPFQPGDYATACGCMTAA